jgi:hypothetical protein
VGTLTLREREYSKYIGVTKRGPIGQKKSGTGFEPGPGQNPRDLPLNYTPDKTDNPESKVEGINFTKI